MDERRIIVLRAGKLATVIQVPNGLFTENSSSFQNALSGDKLEPQKRTVDLAEDTEYVVSSWVFLGISQTVS